MYGFSFAAGVIRSRFIRGAGWRACTTIAAVALSAGAARAAVFATRVVDYTPGAGIDAKYQDPNGALGKPEADTTFGILTPFNATFAGGQMTGVGQGGQLTLQLSDPVPANGRTIGIHAAVGLTDYNYPNGQAGDGSAAQPLAYTSPRQATLSVSDDGAHWVSLGDLTFDIPTNFYDQGVTTPGYQTTPGTHEADFAKPFTGALNDFAGKDWAGVLSVLDGSAGGTWIDLSATGLSQVDFVRFTEPNAGETVYVDAVSAVPEPVTGGLIVVAAIALTRRRTVHRDC